MLQDSTYYGVNQMGKYRIHPTGEGQSMRMSYQRQKEVLPMPNLIEVQTDSYKWFLEKGLQEVFDDISPIEDFSGRLSLSFISYKLCEDKVKYTIEKCKERDATYAAPLMVRVRLFDKENDKEIKGSPSWFVECLSHDMVVIQIPKIAPRPNSALDNLLTLFDQRNQDPDNHHFINYNISDYDFSNDELHDDMRFIVRRLEQATASEEMIFKMCLEDKVEEMLADKKNAEEKVAEQEKMLQEKDSQIQDYKNEVEKLRQLLKQHGVSPS